MGFQEDVCVKTPINEKNMRRIKMNITCQMNTGITSVIDTGLIMSKGFPNAHSNDRIISTCELSDEERYDEFHPWMKQFDDKKFAEDILKDCEGKFYCYHEFSALDYMPMESIETHLTIFAKIACRSNEDQLTKKNLVAMAAACFGIMIVIVYQTSIAYEGDTVDISRKQLEIESLVTVDRFAIKCNVPKELLELSDSDKEADQESNNHLAVADGETKIEKKKDSRARKTIERLNRGFTSKLGLKKGDIVDIKFLFQNGELLGKLEERTKAMVKGDKEKVEKIQEEMNNLKDDPKKFDLFVTPKKAFITFKNQSSVQKALNLKK